MTPTTNNVEPTTSATDELRRLLDERGAEWHRTPHYSSESIDNETVFRGEGIEWIANDHLNGHIGLRALRYEVTPKQAVEATLGRGTCKAVYSPNGVYCSVCHGGGLTIPRRGVNALRNYCPNCGRKIDGRRVVGE